MPLNVDTKSDTNKKLLELRVEIDSLKDELHKLKMFMLLLAVSEFITVVGLLLK